MKHILFVDSNRNAFDLVMKAMIGKYRISKVSSADMAFEFLEVHHPDLIVSLLEYTDMDGLHFLGLLKNNPAIEAVPVILLMNEPDEEKEKQALDLGAADLLISPFIPEILLTRVSNLLELQDYRTNHQKYIKYQDAISVSIAELVECRDVTTGGHLKNTTAYFKLLLEEVISRAEYKDFIPEEDVRDLIRCAPLHDIGKVGISDEILRKASSLDYNEFEYMKTHTILGKETFEKIMKETGETRLLQLARDLAYCHHERWDGSGYPNGLKGEEIPFYARILAIADVYDALTSRRTYKEAFSHLRAVEIIREGKGSLFDSKLVDIFIDISHRFEQALENKYRHSTVAG